MKKINIDDIRVSPKLDYIVNNAVKEGYKGYNNKKIKNKKYRNVAIAAVALIIVIATVNSGFVSASVDKIKNTIGDFVIGEHKFSIPKENKMVIGESIEDKKIKVTLNECYVDNNKLMFTTNLDSRKRHDYAQGIEPKISINDQLIDTYENGYTEGYIHNDDNTVDILSSVSLDNIDTNGNLNITIDYNKIMVTNIFDFDKNVSGNWKYNFTIKESEINKQVINKEINKTIMIEDHELNIENMRILPYRIEITTNSIDGVRYILKDDKGNEYKESDGYGDVKNMTINYLIDTKDIKSITIIPRTDFHNNIRTMNYDKAITIDVR